MGDTAVLAGEKETEPTTTKSRLKVYWCHVCSAEVDVIEKEDEELECVRCKGNFVEECAADDHEEEQDNHPSRFVVPTSPPFRSRSRSSSERTSLPPLVLGPGSQQRVQTTSQGPRNVRNIQELLDQVLRGIGMGGAGGVQTGNFTLGDYAFGNMDDVLNQLLQVQGRAKPRTSETFIKNLKEIEVTNDDSSDHTEGCAVCKDCFEKKQIVHKLPCGHFYHRDCILPWIRKHNTCPVCRHVLPSEKSSASTNNTTTTTTTTTNTNSETTNSTTRSSPAPPSLSNSSEMMTSFDAIVAEELDNMLASDNEDENSSRRSLFSSDDVDWSDTTPSSLVGRSGAFPPVDDVNDDDDDEVE